MGGKSAPCENAISSDSGGKIAPQRKSKTVEQGAKLPPHSGVLRGKTAPAKKS